MIYILSLAAFASLKLLSFHLIYQIKKKTIFFLYFSLSVDFYELLFGWESSFSLPFVIHFVVLKNNIFTISLGLKSF